MKTKKLLGKNSKWLLAGLGALGLIWLTKKPASATPLPNRRYTQPSQSPADTDTPSDIVKTTEPSTGTIPGVTPSEPPLTVIPVGPIEISPYELVRTIVYDVYSSPDFPSEPEMRNKVMLAISVIPSIDYKSLLNLYSETFEIFKKVSAYSTGATSKLEYLKLLKYNMSVALYG